MSAQEDGPDTSSIPSISSLRSRFETLAGGTRYEPIHADRKFGATDARPTSNSSSQVPRTPRPKSMLSVTPSQKSPPMLTIESPRSPGLAKLIDLRPPTNVLQSPIVRQDTNSPTRSHFHTRSAGASDILESRTASSLGQPPETLLPSLTGNTIHGSRDGRTSPAQPPPVNRAAKPKIPVKPSSLMGSTEALNAPQRNFDATDRSLSPFNTPPGTRNNSPEKESAMQSRPRYTSEASVVEPPRGNSGDSSVARTRIDSDASPFGDRVRTDSEQSLERLTISPGGQSSSSQSPTVGQRRELPSGGGLPSFDRLGHSATLDQPASGPTIREYSRPSYRPELHPFSRQRTSIKSRSLGTSPVRANAMATARSIDGLARAAAYDDGSAPQEPVRPVLPMQPAHNEGIQRPSTKGLAPAVPPPRRSVDKRSEPPPAQSVAITRQQDVTSDATPEMAIDAGGPGIVHFPDASQSNRRPPKYRRRPYYIPTEYDTRLLAVSGEIVCTSGYITKAWNWRTGEQILNLVHGENVKTTAIVFKPAATAEAEGKRVWLGTSAGEIHEVDIASQRLVKTKTGAHSRREIIRMYRYAAEVWTLDESGDLNVWKPDHTGLVSLDSMYKTFRVPRGHTSSLACGPELWIATGKEVRVVRPSARSESEFYIVRDPMLQPNAGDITSGAILPSRPHLIYFGHSDGKVSVYDQRDHSFKGTINVSTNRINCLVGVGDLLWAGYSNGMAYAYDPLPTTWIVKKEWRAHEKPICSIVVDPSAMWKMDRLQVVTLGTDNMLRFWDGTLEEDWLDSRMHGQDLEYCAFREMTVALLTWNAGASKPSHLQHSIADGGFLHDYMRHFGFAPDIFVFGFQELVDLEDKKLTAKSFFKSKKKDPHEQEHMSHQYRAWRDHLVRCLEDYMPANEPYTLLHSDSLVGLFTCVFVRAEHRSRIRHVHAAEVKRGMGGLHGNKGALIVRMVIDDSSLCLVNCHLAAGQTQTLQRNNDIAGILEAENLPPYPLHNGSTAEHGDVFVSGGDGAMILDHEICILSGDLNYRIDTMGRDTVVKHVQTNNLGRLLERDQLLLSRKKNPGFRLRAFHENPITFAPTYKYNVRSDEYDTSEKRRSPAWCDRILYRGMGRVKLEGYRRWEVRASDHRPVSGLLRVRVKTVDAGRRQRVWERCQHDFAAQRRDMARAVQLAYLTRTLGMGDREARAALDTGSRSRGGH